MLVRFDSKAGALTMFGDIAVHLLRMMGQTGQVPGAILSKDIPGAVERLNTALGAHHEPAQGGKTSDEEPRVALRHRALPLIELLERAAKTGADVIWEQEGKKA